MAKNRIKLCWLLLLVLMYTTNLLLAVAPAQARYENTVTGGSLIEAQAYGMSSDCLVSREEPALTVLVGELSKEKSTTVSFWLKSSGSNAVGKLAWSVENPDHREFLQVDVRVGPEAVDPEEEIELLKDVSMDFSLILKPTPIEHERLKVNVLVTWGEEMWGTFQVILPEMKEEEEEPPETVEPDPEDPENIPGENTGTGDDTGEGDETGTGDDTGEGDETGTGDGSENGTSDAGIDNDDTIKDDTTGDGGAATVELEEEPEEEEAEIRMQTIPRFIPTEKLPLKIALTKEITAIRLGLEATAEDEIWIDPFPDETIFSLNNGAGSYLMYDGSVLDLRLQEPMTELFLQLDLSRTKLDVEDELVLMMEAYAGETLVETCSIVTVPDALESCVTRLHPLDAETGEVIYTIEPAPLSEEETEQKSRGWESRVLSQNNALEFALPMQWIGAELEYSVEILTMTESQTLEYRPVTLSASGLSVRYTDYDLTHNLMLRVGANLPKAGTYRLNMKWSYEGICFAQTQTTFFINYSAQTANTLGSQEVSQ